MQIRLDAAKDVKAYTSDGLIKEWREKYLELDRELKLTVSNHKVELEAAKTELSNLKEEHDTAMEVVGLMDISLKTELEDDTIQNMPFDRIRTLLDVTIGEPIDVLGVREWLSRISANQEQLRALLKDKDDKIGLLKKRLKTLKDTISSQNHTVTNY